MSVRAECRGEKSLTHTLVSINTGRELLGGALRGAREEVHICERDNDHGVADHGAMMRG